MGCFFGGKNITSLTIIAIQVKPPYPQGWEEGTAFRSRNVTVFVTLRKRNAIANVI
jgi:hypothetical protein